MNGVFHCGLPDAQLPCARKTTRLRDVAWVTLIRFPANFRWSRAVKRNESMAKSVGVRRYWRLCSGAAMRSVLTHAGEPTTLHELFETDAPATKHGCSMRSAGRQRKSGR
jgi:hypothetical protein